MTADTDSSTDQGTGKGIDKEQVRADLIAHLRGEESSADASIDDRESAAQAPDDQEHRVDDDSQRDEAGDQRAALQENEAAQLALISLAKGLDMSPTQVVQPGAIVTLDGTSYVVGVPTDEFTSGGASFAGIATDAPVYQLLLGKRAGETVVVAGSETTIDAVV